MNRLVATTQRAWASVKAAAMVFVGTTRNWTAWSTNRTRYNYAAGVEPRANAIVQSVTLWLCRTFPEAPIRVQARSGDTLTPLPAHPMLLLLEVPNPHYSGILLWMATIADWMITGNAYWLKVRSGAGRVVQLWWVPSSMMEPRWPDNGSEYLSHYDYSPNNAPIRVEPGDVVHFRYGLDPANMRKGLSPLASLTREVFTDDEAANFSASLLRNLGVPGVIISPESDTSASMDDLAASKRTFIDTFGGDRRGEPMVMSGPTKVQVLSFNPQEMDLKTLRRLPEERVTAVFGIPAVVVGLGAGLDRSTFANFAEAREAAYESNVIPSQRLIAAELKTQLLVDFGDVSRFVVDFDLSGVRVLQDDQNALATRLQVLYDADLLRRSEARQMLGQPVGPEDEGYKSELAPEPAPPPPMQLPPGSPPPDAVPPPDEGPQTRAQRSQRAFRAMQTIPGAAISGFAEPDVALMHAGDWPDMPRLGRRKSFTSPDEWTKRATEDVATLTEAATPALERLFARTGRAVLAALPARLPTKALVYAGSNGHSRKDDDALPNLLPASHAADLTRTLRDVHETAIARSTDSVANGLGLSFELPFAVTDSVLDSLATRIGGIADTTRDDVRRIVRGALDRGATIDDLRDDLRGLFTETYKGRSRAIARTESATAYNVGSVASYRESGLVTHVTVHDGDDDEPCASANGSTWTLERAAAEPTAHPNCVRCFSPLVS